MTIRVPFRMRMALRRRPTGGKMVLASSPPPRAGARAIDGPALREVEPHEPQRAEVAPALREGDWAVAVRVCEAGVRSRVQQHLDAGAVAVGSDEMQRCLRGVIQRMHIRAGLEEYSHDVVLALQGGVVQRRPSLARAGVHAAVVRHAEPFLDRARIPGRGGLRDAGRQPAGGLACVLKVVEKGPRAPTPPASAHGEDRPT
eukprot:CAMPEP_0206028156 /NCGR_PEP_ID=MMETSP1464-20131121/44466_1 /ASSEMBLY_ACC=CAM_ASM_001124 /TAXON_ID=119497 /ORGANISM="Exanthemachrysis gayraliae, Strain RCC1523" /LENGTH=200 /DNA_ID=CAMNT_0053402207 /DNA_START=61 /DNA_END=660 /DNA_ORIENTATION=-